MLLPRRALAVPCCVAIAGLLPLAAPLSAQSTAPRPAAPSPNRTMTLHANGTFVVKITPQPADAYADGEALGRMTLDKEFQGDLQGTSRGQMLTGMSSVKGSAGYVAVERVTGTLAGRRGSFVLQHSGTMDRGAQRLTITVVPDTGTEGLVGIAGTMTITITPGQHAYAFTYTLPAAP